MANVPFALRGMGMGSLRALNYMPANPVVDPIGCLSRSGDCRHSGVSLSRCRAAHTSRYRLTLELNCQSEEQDDLILAASVVAARTSPASRSAPRAVSRVPDKGLSFSKREPRPDSQWAGSREPSHLIGGGGGARAPLRQLIRRARGSRGLGGKLRGGRAGGKQRRRDNTNPQIE
jgi:hypothetical protein